MKKIKFINPSFSKPIGPYSTMVKCGYFVFLSGQIALNPDSNSIEETTTYKQTKKVLENIEKIVSEVGLSKENIIKCTVFLKNMGDFFEMNKAYEEFFGEHKPVRTTVEVSKLPKDALVEIEVVCGR